MKEPKDSKGKVIIIPRPPRSNNQEWVPIDPVEQAGPVQAIDSNAGHLGPQVVSGPQMGLAGQQINPSAPAPEEPEEAEAEAE